MIRGGLVHERCGEAGEMWALGRRVSVPRFARGRGRRCWAGNQLRARSDRCAGCRGVVTRAWPGSSYSWERIDRDLRGRPAGSCGAAGSAGSGLRRILSFSLCQRVPGGDCAGSIGAAEFGLALN